MKIHIEQDTSADEVEITIRCPEIDDAVKSILAAANMADRKLIGTSDGMIRTAPIADVLYIESVDGRTFIYLVDAVLESRASLMELEEGLASANFLRATRSMLVNMRHIKGIKPYINARLELVMDNDERVIVSRQFAPAIKQTLGL